MAGSYMKVDLSFFLSLFSVPEKARDIAAAKDRYKRFNFEESLYVVAHQQELHFKQVFKVLELMGYDWFDKCKHISFGLLQFSGTKMSTRD